ncbi:MAG: PAS domain S-box protein [Desulfatirhabdiaceae bacterium]
MMSEEIAGQNNFDIRRQAEEKNHADTPPDTLQAEEALKASENNLKAMIQAIPEVAFLIDTNGVVLNCNPVAANRMGHRPEEIIGRVVYDYLSPEIAVARRQHIDQIINTGEPLAFEDVRSGHVFRNYLYPIKDDSGKVHRIAVFADDITEFKQVETDLNRQKDLLDAIRVAQSLFISGQDTRQVYQDLLGVLVRHTDSVFGFLDEVLYESDGTPYKLNLALSNIAWDDDSRDLYEQLVARKLEFRNLNNLAGAPVLEKKTIITNNPARHPRYQGMPKGHPPITSYMGIPVVFRDRIIGVAGVANRPGGYSDDIAASIKPLINACAAMIWGERILQRDRENQAALQSSREKFRMVADFTYDWEYWIAPDGSLPYVSPSCERITGYRPEAFQNDPGLMMRIIHPDDASPITDHLFAEYRLSELGICRMDFRIINRSGEELWISHICQPVLGTDGQYLGRRASNRDISKRKRAMQELQELRDHFEMVFNMNPDGAQITRLTDGCVVNINEGVTAMTGYTREDMIGKRTLDIDLWENPDDRQHVLDALEENGFCENYEAVFRRKDGTRFVGMMSSRRYLYRGIPHAITVTRDISDRKQTEEQARYLQKAESLGRMAGAIAHHFNNHLQAVMGNLELAMEDLPEEMVARQSLTGAMQSARNAAEVSLLMLTYLGQTPGRREILDLSDCCIRHLFVIKAAMPENIEFRTDLPLPGPTVHANANQIGQVLSNLITNAREAVGPDPGVVELGVKTVCVDEIPASDCFSIDWQPQKMAYACLEVRDTGSGIPEENMKKLFDPFFSTRFIGRGLGLSVVLGIVKAHEGGICIESKPGVGTVFRVFLPLFEDDRGQSPYVPESPECKWNGMALVVDDEDSIRHMARMMLTRMGFRVLAAKDGVEAVDLLRRHPDEIRFVLCDLSMPRMDGWETLAEMRRIRPGIPVILASGYSETQVMNGRHAEMPQAFLGKPYLRQELDAAIRKSLA